MYKIHMVSLLLVLLLVIAGCTEVRQEASVVESAVSSTVESVESNIENMEPPSETSDLIPAESSDGAPVENLFTEQIKTLKPGEYPQLEMTAAVLERKAILPGHPVNVHVTLKNNGDKKVVYVMGSGSAIVPDSLLVAAQGLQMVKPKEHYGAMTMDYRMNTLEPGATVEYVYTVLTIAPVDNFNDIAMALLKEDIYPGIVPLAEYADKYPELKAAEPGNYLGKAVLMFSVIDPDGEVDVTGSATTFAEADFSIAITG